jgi:Asp-tRNA(Asn)/Glu-tRNA(Gln) amidotransferase A subunit family amidase
MKDLYQTIEGVPVTNGSRAFAGVVGQSDSLLVQRYRAAGVNIVCTSTTPELAISATTESTLYGATRNPWDLARTSGGSSGGASALVAAGVLPAAHATDGGGSIRGPASCCGLFGLKPSRGRVPIAPGRTEGWGGCSTTHAVTRSVRDSAVLLDLAHGAEPGSRYVAPPPRAAFADAVEREPGQLRIAFNWRTRAGVEPDPVCIEAVRDAARLCEDLGHIVEEAAPDLDDERLARSFGLVVVVSAAVAASRRAKALGLTALDQHFEPVTAEYVEIAKRVSAERYAVANDRFMAAALTVSEFQETYDVILTPTMGRPPVEIGAACLMQTAEAYAAATLPFSCFTALQNQTGQPAMTVPLFWSGDSLPIGVQFAGRLGEEELLFSLAAQLERARPWFARRAPIAPEA